MSYLDEQTLPGPTPLSQTPGGDCDPDFSLCPKPVNPSLVRMVRSVSLNPSTFLHPLGPDSGKHFRNIWLRPLTRGG